ncbi:hypothetical protein BC941DRAFT_445657 [Chlamydoabsidia padenii]|nr:hypothetical protein BC941DRAFT_445657 [Chlamydoabsidia padenii]
MNIFRLVADLMHLASIFILLLKIKTTRSCVGKKKKRNTYQQSFHLTIQTSLLFQQKLMD